MTALVINDLSISKKHDKKALAPLLTCLLTLFYSMQSYSGYQQFCDNECSVIAEFKPTTQTDEDNDTDHETSASTLTDPLTDNIDESEYDRCLKFGTNHNLELWKESSTQWATGNNLVKVKNCLSEAGINFDARSVWWVNKVNTYCVGSLTDGELQSIGSDYNRYLNCLRDRDVIPEVNTIDPTYPDAVTTHCWYREEANLAASLTIRAVAVVGGAIIGAATSAVTLNPALGVTVGSIIAVATIPATSSLHGVDYTNVPRSLHNYGEYVACLNDRDLPGLDFEPSHTQSPEERAKWEVMVKEYCGTRTYVGGKFSDYNAYWQCFKDRDSDFEQDNEWKVGVKEHCDSGIYGGGRFADYNAYWQCFKDRDVAFENNNKWRNGVKGHCDGLFYAGGGRFANYSPYWKCFTDRDTTFVNNDEWKNGVRSHCANSNGSLNGYQTCLQQRQVPYVESIWKNHVKQHCDSATFVPSRFGDYNGYWKCFTDRGTTFINNADWKNGVKEYCEGQWYPFGGKDKCYSDRQVSP